MSTLSELAPSTDGYELAETNTGDGSELEYTPAGLDSSPNQNYGYGILDEELDEEALLAGADFDDDEDNDDRPWRH